MPDGIRRRFAEMMHEAESTMTLSSYLKQKAATCKRQVYTLWIAYRDPRMPMHAKVFCALIVAYALSPIDLIPDFIPILGYLDDIILLPLGIMLAIKMIPTVILDESREKAQLLMDQRLPRSRAGICLMLSIWLVGLAAAGFIAAGVLRP